MGLEFKTIDLARDMETCIRFRKDSYLISFGNLDQFEKDILTYERRMIERIGYFPQGNCHLWRGGEIIGQTEMKFVEDERIGYVSFFYLAPEVRGMGYGEALHLRAVREFKAVGKECLKLSVSPENGRALAYYRKMGWTSLGPRPGREHMLLFSYDLMGA